jgi:hypothetical protein
MEPTTDISDEAWVCEVEADAGYRDSLMRFVWSLIVFQFFACLLAMLRYFFPPTIGISAFSIAVDFRYLGALLLGAYVALLIFVLCVFTWSNRSAYWRVTACVPVLFLLCVYGAACFLFFLMSSPTLLRNLMPVTCLIFSFSIGVAVIPLILRAFRGNQLTRFVPHRFGSQKAGTDWGIVIGLLAIIFLAIPIFDYHAGVSVLAAGIGMAVGLPVLLFATWLFKEQSRRALWFAILSFVLLFLVTPLVGAWLADHVYFPLLPAGSGVWFVGVFSAALFLLLHALLFRGIGYRMKNYSRRKAVAPTVKKPVVDPFSD